MGGRAIVTGAGSGIGRAIALELAKEGFELLLVGRNVDRLVEAADECALHSAAGHRACDLSDGESVERLCRDLREGPSIDALVSSAGTIILNDIEQAQISELDTMMNTNFRAPLLLVRSLLPTFSDGGSMVFINSMAGLRTSEFNVLYSTTKHAMKAMTNGLRLHLAPRHIRVLSVYPPLTATPTGEYVKAFYGSEYRPERLLQPTAIASAVGAWIVDASNEETELLFPEEDARPT
jgi:short-subunit dehydrogenase